MKYIILILLLLMFPMAQAQANDEEFLEDQYVTVGETLEVQLNKQNKFKYSRLIQVKDNNETNRIVGLVSIRHQEKPEVTVVKCTGRDGNEDFVLWNGAYRTTASVQSEFVGKQTVYEYVTQDGLEFRIVRKSKFKFMVYVKGKLKQFRSWTE